MRSDEVLKKTEEGIKESNKILVRELMRDLEEKGIPPVVAIDGKVKNLTLSEGEDLKNFEKELKKLGLEKCDFCLLKEDKKTKEKTANLIVVEKKSGKVRQYKHSHWIAEFHHDLKNNFFN